MTIAGSHEPMLLVYRDPRQPERLVTRRRTSWDAVRDRVLGTSLDHQLAAGRSPEANRRLATRAENLVSPTARRALAQHWEHLFDLIGQPPAGCSARVPLCGDRIAKAEAEVREMIAALRADVPAPVRGVAMASLLLSDGAGPLTNRGSTTDLRTAVREVTAQLDPWAGVITPA